jgi:lipid A ethanolaminephosphotransferase
MPSSTRFGVHAPVLSPVMLNLVVCAYLMALCNATFWGHLFRVLEGRTFPALIFAGAMFALLMLVVTLAAVRRAQKPVLVAMVLLAAVASFYADTMGVVIDRDMIQNAMTTTVTESRHLITPVFLGHVAAFGLLPSALILWVRVRRASLRRGVAGWALGVAGWATMVVGLLYSDLATYSSLLRNQKEVLASLQPLAPIGASFRYAKLVMRSAQVEVIPTGMDARPGRYLAAADKPVLMVIVAGETARAANWSLGGYGRETNPELSARDVLYYPHVTSCGTATAVSLPCMFSPLRRTEYTHEGGLSHENLLDVLARAGFDVQWWDNNTSDKGIATRVTMRRMTAEDGAEFCQPECTDDVFLPHLERLAQTITRNTVVVLHQIGSHGPSYWLRYPPEAEVFKPACRNPDLSACTAEEIVNAYDNTIAFTDHVLARAIDTLDAAGRVIPALYYASDHGESLGENGIYLHGSPWFMAPEAQTHVPMLIWMAPRFRAAMGLDQTCMAARLGGEVSHDHMFSTVIDLLDVVTDAEVEALDLADPCRGLTG